VLNKIIKNLRISSQKPWLPISLVALFLLFAGIFAITQEAEEESDLDDILPDDMAFDFEGEEMEMEEGEPLPVWIPPGPPRWFRSNAGGMALEETPSRLAALRNKYALVIDYIDPVEIEPRLLSYYKENYTAEIRVLYEQKKETRRQWLFRDEAGIIRLNAVFSPPAEETDVEEELEGLEEELIESEFVDEEFIENEFSEIEFAQMELTEETETESTETDELAEAPSSDEEDFPDEFFAEAMPDIEPIDVIPNKEAVLSVGFIELYNEKTQIIEDRWLFADDSETVIAYFYNGATLVSTETREIPPDEESRILYTDKYRYNRSFSLRHVERVYHAEAVIEPVRLAFPSRVLEAASNPNFISDKLSVSSDFIGSFFVGEGFRVEYNTDSRGRILTQTMLDSKSETVWTITNTWLGDRIIAVLKTEGKDEKLTEYEYNDAGKRIVQRDIHNDVIERVVYTEGENETEELYMDGVMVLKAYWENGRKISEERVRRR